MRPLRSDGSGRTTGFVAIAAGWGGVPQSDDSSHAERIEQDRSLGLQRLPQAVLVATLNWALLAVDADNPSAASWSLNAFINQVQRLSRRSISKADADLLFAAAEGILAMLEEAD